MTWDSRSIHPINLCTDIFLSRPLLPTVSSLLFGTVFVSVVYFLQYLNENFGNALVSNWKAGSVPWEENITQTVTHNDTMSLFSVPLKHGLINLGGGQYRSMVLDMHILCSVRFHFVFFDFLYISSYWCWLFWQLFPSFQCTISVWNVFIYNGKYIVFVIFLTFCSLDPLVADQVRSLDQVVRLCSVCYFNSKTLFYCSVNHVLCFQSLFSHK